jgi:hypothetical protein
MPQASEWRRTHEEMGTEMSPNYSSAQCAAITKTGHRCSGGWSTAMVTSYGWDPAKGVGFAGPHVVLCHRHRWWTEERGVRTGKRFPVEGGWLGAANDYGHGVGVYDAAAGPRKVPAWLKEHVRPCVFGGPFRRYAI